MEHAFRGFMGEVLRLKRTVLAAPSASACDVIQQRVRELYDSANSEALRHVSAHDAKTYSDVQYIMIAAADEAFLQFEWAGRAAWATHPLEAQVWHSHDAGERFFQVLDEVLERRLTLPVEVLLVYLHALSIGFRGAYAPLDPAAPEAYRKRLIEHLGRLGDRFTRPATALSPEATSHTITAHSRLKLASLSQGALPLIIAVVAFLVLGGVLFQLRTSVLDDVLERIEAIK